MRKVFLISLCIISIFVNNAKSHNLPGESTVDYSNVPLFFTVNKGQTDKAVLFSAKGSRCTMFFSEKGTTFYLTNISAENKAEHDAYAVKLLFINTGNSAQIKGNEILNGTTNYFISNDQSKWITDIPNYSSLKINNLYEGVDLVYYGNQNRLEYDLIVQPGIDPKQILLSYDLGDEIDSGLSIDESGNLIVTTPLGQLVEQKPLCYQIVENKKVYIEGNYRIVDKKKNVFSFALAGYDKNRPLIIDPVIEYASYFGGGERDWCYGATKDESGNIYFSGNTVSTDYPTKAGSYSLNNVRNVDCFITKLDPTCTKIIYSTYIGSYGDDYGGGVAVDKQGNAYMTANTNSYYFPVTENAMFKSRIGPGNVPHPDIVIIKLSPEGNSLVYSSYFGGSGIDAGGHIYPDEFGNVYISLYTESDDLPVTEDVFGNKRKGGKEGYILKLDSAGNKVFATYLGGADDDYISAIVTDKKGNLIVCGTSKSSDFPQSSSALNCKPHPDMDLFVTKINKNASKILFSARIGGTGNEGMSCLKLDENDNIYISGFTESKDFPVTKNSIQNSLKGPRDGFLTSISNDGNKLLYSTFFGGDGFDKINALEPSKDGFVYITGSTSSNDFPVTKDAFDQTYNGGKIINAYGGDVFLCLLDINKSKLKYSSYFGGIENEESPNLIVSNENEILLIGQTESNDLPVTKNALNKSNKGKNDVFIVKLSINNKLNKNSVPQITNPVKDINADFNRIFKIRVPEDLFTDKDDFEILPLEFSLRTGEPLPAWMKYDTQNRILMGLPPKEGKWNIKISTTDNHNAKVSTEFQILVTDPRKDKKVIDFEYGLIAYYPLNGNADDFGPNHYNGIVKRAIPCEDRTGKQNSAYFFNGSDKYIQIDSIKELEEIDVITVCAWISPASYENYVGWVSKALNENRSQFRASFGTNPDKSWGLTHYNETWYAYEAGDCNIPLNQWSFVVITANQITGEVKNYLNGKEVGSNGNLKGFLISSHPWYIGYQADDKSYFDGKIDEVRFYKRILSADEIMTLYKMN